VTVFIDSGYYIAFLVPRDRWFGVAERACRSDFRAVTSSLVVNEAASLLQARGLFSTALAWLAAIREESDTQIIHVDPVLQSEAWNLVRRWGGSGANPLDCASFAIMRRLNIKKAFTFDRHFRTAGFDILG
jgi:predicted nucleic acid-binding protein